MYFKTVRGFAETARQKGEFLKKNPIRYFIAAILAGIYVGFGIILIFSVAGPFATAGSPAVKLILGLSFGVALTLAIFAGSELFTGLNMVMIIGLLRKTSSLSDLFRVWGLSYVGNLAGSLSLAALMHFSGLMNNAPTADLMTKVVGTKMQTGFGELFVRGILCNMLVCLAVWMSARTKDDSAKAIVIFWCLFAFIGSGFEHSVANMSLLGFPLLHGIDGGGAIGWQGYVYNLTAVSLGNIVGGGIFIGAAYACISGKQSAAN